MQKAFPEVIKLNLSRVILTLLLTLVGAQSWSLELDLPLGSWPVGGSTGITITPQRLLVRAEQYCEEVGSEAEAEEFVMGFLAQSATEEICYADAEEIPQLLGEFYVSGILGGIWLRDQLNPESIAAAEKAFMPAEIALNATPSSIEDGIPLFMFERIQLLTDLLIDFANTEVESDQKLGLNLSVPLFLTVTGYNRGYLEHILDNPPQGLEPPTQFLQCEHFLYCVRPGMELDVLESYADIIQQLRSEPLWSLKWQWFQLATVLFGEGSKSLGAGVWDNIGVEGMSEPAYRLLIDLSARFLMISEVSLLAAMDALGNENPESAQCAFRQQAAMMAWMGSYFSGLSSAQPNGTFAHLSCN